MDLIPDDCELKAMVNNNEEIDFRTRQMWYEIVNEPEWVQMLYTSNYICNSSCLISQRISNVVQSVSVDVLEENEEVETLISTDVNEVVADIREIFLEEYIYIISNQYDLPYDMLSPLSREEFREIMEQFSENTLFAKHFSLLRKRLDKLIQVDWELKMVFLMCKQAVTAITEGDEVPMERIKDVYIPLFNLGNEVNIVQCEGIYL